MFKGEKYVSPVWAISTYKGKDLMEILKADKFHEPVLTKNDISGISAEFIADPFIIKENDDYYMFFELLDKVEQKGCIGLATSKNGLEWKYDKVVLNEKFHLSYPYVFKHEEEYYMIPECGESGYIKLYYSKNFPYEWECVADLIEGTYGDASIIFYDNKFWIFAEKMDSKGNRNCNLHLYYSDNLKYGWIEHPKSPLIIGDYSKARPAGRIIMFNNDIIRFSQNDLDYYGKSVNMHKVTKLTVDDYDEEVIKLDLSGTGNYKQWNKDGMHQVDCCKLNDDEWLVAVDGHYFNEISKLEHKLNRAIIKIKRKLHIKR
ncbi:glucosamine inositolphosphorylceramide transferase family protein [Clostridium sp.]